MTEQRCGTCKWLRVTPDKAGRRVVRKANAYLCAFEPAWPPLPDSITSGFSFRLPKAQFVVPMSGVRCPVWEEFEK